MQAHTDVQTPHYYVPEPSYWPLVGSLALLALATGFVMFLNKLAAGPYVLAAGIAISALYYTHAAVLGRGVVWSVGFGFRARGRLRDAKLRGGRWRVF